MGSSCSSEALLRWNTILDSQFALFLFLLTFSMTHILSWAIFFLLDTQFDVGSMALSSRLHPMLVIPETKLESGRS